MGYEQIPGYSGFLHVYEDFVRRARPGAVVVEVGVALGHSIAFLARQCLDAGRRDVKAYAVDPWEGVARNGEQQTMAAGAGGDFNLFVRSMLEHAPAELELVRVLRLPSKTAATLFAAEGIGVDLVMIDGAHDEASVFEDVTSWLPTLRAGGTMAGDDCEPNYPGVEAAVRRVFGDRWELKGTTWIVEDAAQVVRAAPATIAAASAVKAASTRARKGKP